MAERIAEKSPAEVVREVDDATRERAEKAAQMQLAGAGELMTKFDRVIALLEQIETNTKGVRV